MGEMTAVKNKVVGLDGKNYEVNKKYPRRALIPRP